jgi:hypothetical protein
MWLNLLVLLMLVLITFFQSLQGLFAAMILLVLSVISSVVAFGFYEDLHKGLIAQWLPGEGQAVSLMVLFLVTLLVLRVVLDTAIKGNVLLPQRANRIGGGILGFFAAMVMTGTAVTAIQMLPFDQEVLGFSRAQVVGGRLVTRGVWFGADRFAVGLAGTILDGSLTAKTPRSGTFEDIHPDLLADVDARRSAGVPAPQKPNAVSLSVEQVWSPEKVMGSDGKTPINPESGRKFLAVRVNLGGDLPPAFTPQQMRMVGVRANRVEQYILKAASAENDVPVEMPPLSRYGSASGTMNLVYEIPAVYGTAPNKAWYVTFNGEGMGEVTESQLKEQSAPALSTPGAATSAEPKKDAKPAAPPKPQVKNPLGRTHGADVTDQPIVSEDWPLGLSVASNEIAGGAELVSSRLKDGHIVLQMSKTSTSKIIGFVSRFEVPKGMKLVQVPLHRVSPGSLMGQAIDFAVRTLQQQWALLDDAGGQYLPAGAVAIASVGGAEMLEIQYHVNPENLVAGHTLTKWRRISDADLKSPDAKLFFLYLVPPGKHVISFDTGRQKVDLDLKVE